MGQIKVTAAGFGLRSSYTCWTKSKYYYYSWSGSPFKSEENVSGGGSSPPTVSQIVNFAFKLPEGATITSAKVYATIGNSLFGAALSTINGVYAQPKTTASVDITIPDGASSVDVEFAFRSALVRHNPLLNESSATESTSWDIDAYVDDNDNTVDIKNVTRTETHNGTQSYNDVYLLIEYEDLRVPIDTTLEVTVSSSKGSAKVAMDNTVTYTIKVTNKGNVPFTNVKIADTLTGKNWTIAEIAVGATKTYTTTYTVIYADVKRGSVANGVTAMGDSIPDYDTANPAHVPRGTASVANTVDKTGFVYRAEGGVLVAYRLFRAEGGALVLYHLHHAENGALVPY